MEELDLLCEIRSMHSVSSVLGVLPRLLEFTLSAAAPPPSPSLRPLWCRCSVLCGAFFRRLSALETSLAWDAAPETALRRALFALAARLGAEASALAYAFGELDALDAARLVPLRRRLSACTSALPPAQWDVDAVTAALAAHAARAARRGERPGGASARWRVPLRDCVAQGVISCPARGVDCAHAEVFDVRGFVRAARQKAGGEESACPICAQRTPLHAVRIDERIAEAMRRFTDAGGVLSAHDSVEWEAETDSYTVVPHTAEREAEEVREEGPKTRPRVVRIEGHVLYADE